MKPSEFTALVTSTLADNKAVDITEMDVTSMTDSMDTMIVCTATSTRHAKSLAQKVIEAAKQTDNPPFGVEGSEFGEWVLIDLSDIVVHIMLADQREFYNIEKLWAVTENKRQQKAE